MSIEQNEFIDVFPKTPDYISNMVRNVVKGQLENSGSPKVRSRQLLKTAIITLACFLTLGTTAYAVNKLWELYVEKLDKYAVKTTISGTNAESSSGIAEEKFYTFEAAYLPENLIWADLDSSVSHINDTKTQQVVAALYFSRVENGTEWVDTGVMDSEALTINNHSTVYFHTADGATKYYVLFEEEQLIMSVYNFSIPTEELYKIIENIKVKETADKTANNLIVINTWAIEAQQEEAVLNPVGDMPEWVYQEHDFTTYSCFKEDMKNMHQIGEDFQVTGLVAAKVTNILVTDNNALLDPSGVLFDESAFDEQGKLLTNYLQYIKTGNNIDTLSEIVYQKEIPMKLVYIEVEYINTSKWDLEDIRVDSNLIVATENDKGYQLKSREREDLEYDVVYGNTYALDYHNMDAATYFYNGVNEEYNIPEIPIGESRTVYYAYIVAEEDLPYMYLDLMDHFENHTLKGLSQAALEIGLVDIRQ